MSTQTHDLQAGDSRTNDFPLAASTKAMNPERRRSPREKLHSLVYFDLEPNNGGIVLDLGEGGMRISLAHPLAGAEEIRFSLNLRPGKQVRGTGRIAWISSSGKNAGVTFVSLEREALAQILPCLNVPTGAPESMSEESEQHEDARPVEAGSTVEEAETVPLPVSPRPEVLVKPSEIAAEGEPSILSLYGPDGAEDKLGVAQEPVEGWTADDAAGVKVVEEQEGARAGRQETASRGMAAPEAEAAAARLPEPAAEATASDLSSEGSVEDATELAEGPEVAVVPEGGHGLGAAGEATAGTIADDAAELKVAKGEEAARAGRQETASRGVAAPQEEIAAVVGGGGEVQERNAGDVPEDARPPIPPRRQKAPLPPAWLEALAEAGRRDRWEDVFPKAWEPKEGSKPKPPESVQIEPVAVDAASEVQGDVRTDEPPAATDSKGVLYLPNYWVEPDHKTGDVRLTKLNLRDGSQFAANLACERLEEFGWTLERDWHIWVALVLLVAGFLALAQKPPLVLIAGALWLASGFIAVKRKQRRRPDETSGPDDQ